MNSFFFNYTATTEIYTLSLHDALPICYVLTHVMDFSNPQNAHLFEIHFISKTPIFLR